MQPPRRDYMKYKTLDELHHAIAHGDVDIDAQLVIDNTTAAFYNGDECVYRTHIADLVQEALDMLDIPWEYA
jgi:hypothetical protein